MASGVAWNCPGRAGIAAPGGVIGCSPVFHVHATASRPTFDRSIVVSGEYLSPPASPPYTGHSLGLRGPSADRSGDEPGAPVDCPFEAAAVTPMSANAATSAV